MKCIPDHQNRRLPILLTMDGKAGLDKAARLPEGTKIEVPLDIVMSLLRPDELEKLKNYITSYFRKRDSSEVK